MSLEVHIAHGLGPEQARRRLQQVAQRHAVLLAAEDEVSGTLEKRVGFLGRVRARYRIAERTLEIAVLEAPSFVPEATLRRLLEDELGREFGAEG